MYSNPDAERLLRSEVSIYGEPLVQVDELVDDPMPTRLGSVSSTTQSKFCLSDEILQVMCTHLGRIIQPGDDDVYIKQSLKYVWNSINNALTKDLSMSTLLANEEEFQQNVKQKGEQQFIDLLRYMAEKNSWRNLLEHGTYFLSFDPERSDHLLSPDMFLKRNLEVSKKSRWWLPLAPGDGAK